MTSAVEHPSIKFVVYPVHMDGTLTGAGPRMRHDPDCGHFKWGDGTVLGTAVLATEEQMRSLRACSPASGATDLREMSSTHTSAGSPVATSCTVRGKMSKFPEACCRT